MSRANMLYDNEPLKVLPVKTSNWTGAFIIDDIFERKSGTGLILEGIIQGRSRHTIIDGIKSNTRYRLVALHVEVVNATKRHFKNDGTEDEPDFGSSTVVNTGYLSSSYKTVSKEGKDIISAAQCKEMLGVSELDALNVDKFPKIRNVVSIWCEESELEEKELIDGDHVRLRTIGDGPYLESIAVLDREYQTKVNYSSGERLGGSWTDKVLTVTDKKGSGAHLTEESKAVDDDEWGD